MKSIFNKILQFFAMVKQLGISASMDSYKRRRIGIFNLLNFFGFVTGIFIPIAGLMESKTNPLPWMVEYSPALISGVVLFLNYRRYIQISMLWYFITYPLVTIVVVYVGNIDVGIEMFFILYSVLAVFFLQSFISILLAVIVSACSYIFIYSIYHDYKYTFEDINFSFYLFNHLLSIFFVLLGLLLIKKENSSYQLEIVSANDAMYKVNVEVEKQRNEIAEKANLLEHQTKQLTELNTVKNRLFSIISHDLRTPIYGLRNLFKSMEQYDLPGNEIKLLVPDILADLNYTTSLMENLLQWAKSQMQGTKINPQLIDLAVMIKDTQKVLRLQAENKKVYLKAKTHSSVYIYADKDMIDLVLRNLLSNAIKFTPQNGEVFLEVGVKGELVEVSIKDSGIGISEENISQLFTNNYFTTKGTANESGTGLGLMMCKDFLTKNGGEIFVKSEIGKGSVFSFTLPKA